MTDKKKSKLIMGSGGEDDSGGTRTPVIYPDSLRSTAFLRILDLICEGEIVGLVNGSKSIFLNKTPLQNEDDTYNFQNVTWVQRKGTQDQSYITGNVASENEVSVGAQFKYGNPYSGPQPSNTAQSGTAVVRTIVNPEVTSVRVRVSVPSLSTTNPTNGDVTGASVSYSIHVKAADDAQWVKKLDDTITGKSSSKYERTQKIYLHGASPWLIRVQRETPDPSNSYTQNATTFESYTEIIEAKLRYPNSALVGISIDATQFSSVPSRIYEMGLLKIKVPSNYDDVTRTYTGTWDGTFQISTGACPNPAWVFYDLLTSERYGLGQFIPEAQVNKWALYEIAQYCDELVSDGYGGQEPRFTCNLVIPSRTEAYTLMKSLASVFRGMIYWASGAITATQDSPKDPTYLYNQANVIDGKFTYTGTSAQNRHSVARVTWNDPENFYQSTVEYVEDQDAIRDIGVVETEITAFGCTSRGQAHRLGQWLLYTDKYEDETVTFQTGLEGLACSPGDIIQVADPSKAGIKLGGRIKTATTTTVEIDSDIDVNTTGDIIALLPNGTIEQRAINSIVGRVISTTSAFSVAPQSQGVWAVKTDQVEPQVFRVVGVSESEDGKYQVTALKHIPSKFAYIEEGLQLQEPDVSILDQPPDQPQNLQVVESLYAVGTSVRVKGTFSWDRVPLAANYRVSYVYNNGNTVTLPLTQFSEIDILDLSPGTYDFSVVAINSLGKESPMSTITKEIYGKSTPPQDVQNFSLIPSKGNALLTWDRAHDLDVIIGGYVRIRWTPRTTGQLWSDAIDITPALTGNSTSIVAPLLSGTYMAKFVDSSGNYSVTEKLVLTDIPEIYALNTVQTITEDPDFGGTLNDMMYVPSEQAITMISSALFDDVPDVDGLGSFDFFGDIVSTSEYLFEDSIDLLGVWPFRVRINIDLEAYDTGNYIDQRLDNVDDWVNWDGDVINAMDAQVYMRTTEDDPNMSPTWTAWKKVVNAEYVARAAEFKLICTNDEENHNMYIRQLSVTVDMDDRTWNSQKLTSSTGGDYSVVFDNGFFAVPAISVTAENMNTGDYYTISNVDEDGLDISFYDSSNTRVQRDFYILAKSYGMKVA